MHRFRLAPLALLSILALSACSEEPPAATASSDGKPVADPGPLTVLYRCAPEQGEPFEFLAQYHQDALGLWLPDRFGLPYQQLPQVISASGARFENDQALVWNKGDTALLEVAGRSYGECREDRHAGLLEAARLRGVTLRATGNEPGWLLEAGPGSRLGFSYDYGNHQLELNDARPLEEGDGLVAGDGERRLEVRIEPGPCLDTMSDQSFPLRVEVRLDGERYSGCGTRLD
jgi:membrane-bound inhibitor of C-type lysozyme